MSESALRLRLARSLAVGAAFAVFVITGFLSIRHDPEPVDGAPRILRQGFNFNSEFWRSVLGTQRRAVTFPPPAPGTPPRTNGMIGLNSPVSLEDYTVTVEDDTGRSFGLSLDDIKSVSSNHESTLFKCIEGWSRVIDYSGPRFSDFMEKFDVGKKPDGTYYKYVGLETPDQEYYVSIDMESMLHPQTILAFELNGAPLRPEHGAPIRLIIPVKYGIKNLKRIGFISFSDERPPDFWHEQGYDWFSGL